MERKVKEQVARIKVGMVPIQVKFDSATLKKIDADVKAAKTNRGDVIRKLVLAHYAAQEAK